MHKLSKMLFNSPPQYQQNQPQMQPQQIFNAKINNSFNLPMIDRIHKAKPGCSACGKKIA